ncbi:hypothetical protein [Bradyrhizobium sp. BRP23]|uniref:hypothetical protein n=1 Tax=Bradyrhizobium TaxID=374 RepID=UPI001CD3E19A|nr:hypothetical protein [Bradyrhizobium sp. BRP23]
MTVSGRPPNQLLQLLDAADFDLLRPHLATVEMVSKSVVGEIGTAPRHVYLPHGGCVSIRVSLSEGQTIEIAMLGRDSVVGPVRPLPTASRRWTRLCCSQELLP